MTARELLSKLVRALLAGAQRANLLLPPDAPRLRMVRAGAAPVRRLHVRFERHPRARAARSSAPAPSPPPSPPTVETAPAQPPSEDLRQQLLRIVLAPQAGDEEHAAIWALRGRLYADPLVMGWRIRPASPLVLSVTRLHRAPPLGQLALAGRSHVRHYHGASRVELLARAVTDLGLDA